MSGEADSAVESLEVTYGDEMGDRNEALEANGGFEFTSTPQPWPGPFLECMLQASAEVNISSELRSKLQGYTNSSYQQLTDDELYFTLVNDTDFIRGTNGTDLWDTVSDCLGTTSQDRPYLLPWWQQLTWTLAFGSMLTVAVGGNALVMWIVIAHRRMRTVTNYFLVNLSAADLLMSVLNCIFNFIYMLHSDWPFGSVYCTISNFMANVTIAASVFTLMAISFDRYIAIVRPLKPRMTKSEARNFIIFIWASSMLLALPCLLYSTTVSIRYKNNEIRRGCFLLWPDGKTSISYREYVYNIVFFVTTYLLPMLVMLISYSLISCELWGSHSIGELTDRQANSIKSKRRVVRMFIVIVVVFMLCWLPQQGFFLYQYHNNQVLDTANIQHIYLGFYWLAMANAMVNPIIYYWMNARFRSYFREVVLQCRPGRCLCCCCSRSNSYLDSPHLSRRRCDSADHTSRSRSDANGAPRCLVNAVPRHNNHLLVYSSRGKLNNRGALGGNIGDRSGMMQTDSFRLKDFSYKYPPPSQDGGPNRKPLRAEEDWHYIQYLSDQKALRIRNEQTLHRPPVRRVNGFQRNGQHDKNLEDNSKLTAETNLITSADLDTNKITELRKTDGDTSAITTKGQSDIPNDSLPTLLQKSISSPSPRRSKVLIPIVNIVPVTPPTPSHPPPPILPCDSSKDIKKCDAITKGSILQPIHEQCSLLAEVLNENSNNVTKNPIQTLKSVPEEESVSENSEKSSEDQDLSQNTFRDKKADHEDIKRDSILISHPRESYQKKKKYLNDNLVHQAIEETIKAVKKQSLTRDIAGIQTTNVLSKNSSEKKLSSSKELML